MVIRIIQLNHPGVEKNFPGVGYCTAGNQIIREWNDDPNHYRKYIRNKGVYIEKYNDQNPKNKDLYFWGEWEGYSRFYPMEESEPNGIHEPFHSIKERGCQSTDPYVFGDFFKYAICSQKKVMTELDPGSLILFGTTKNAGFYLDTVFVVKTSESAKDVYFNNVANYSQIYREETIEQLGETYLGPNYSKTNSIYHSYTWKDYNKGNDKIDYFSYVPCRIDEKTYGKVKIPCPPMTKQKQGHPYNHLDQYTPKECWKYITNIVTEQGFYLGTKLEEPEINNNLACGKLSKEDFD